MAPACCPLASRTQGDTTAQRPSHPIPGTPRFFTLISVAAARYRRGIIPKRQTTAWHNGRRHTVRNAGGRHVVRSAGGRHVVRPAVGRAVWRAAVGFERRGGGALRAVSEGPGGAAGLRRLRSPWGGSGGAGSSAGGCRERSSVSSQPICNSFIFKSFDERGKPPAKCSCGRRQLGANPSSAFK